MTIRMDEGAAELLDTLHRAGYAAYVVGGCVRDSLLGLTPHDWDLCTSALPQQVMELFGAQRCIPTGLQHGTVTVKQSGALYEITTFRTEGTYTDGRHPDEVHFVPDVRKDLARRDLTINAMAYNEKEGLVDPFGGQADLQSGIVRAVGVPRQRFTEDALRILRLYRFAARFGFSIDPPTAQAAQELCAHLDCVSVERIEEELAKLLRLPLRQGLPRERPERLHLQQGDGGHLRRRAAGSGQGTQLRLPVRGFRGRRHAHHHSDAPVPRGQRHHRGGRHRQRHHQLHADQDGAGEPGL